MSLLPKPLQPIAVLLCWSGVFGWAFMTLVNAHLPKPIIIAGVLLLALLLIYVLRWTIKQLLKHTNPTDP